jgi:hypothetical protein
MFGWMTDGTAVEILFGYLTLVTMRRDGPDFRFFFRLLGWIWDAIRFRTQGQTKK